MGSTTLSVVSSEHDYKSRLVVLLETDGAANSSKIGDVVDAVTRMARQAPDGQPVAFGVYAGKAVFTKGFFTDPDERTRAIGALPEEAGSLFKPVALYYPLHDALKPFCPHPPF